MSWVYAYYGYIRPLIIAPEADDSGASVLGGGLPAGALMDDDGVTALTDDDGTLLIDG